MSISGNLGTKKNYKSYVYNSSFDGKIISNLFSNLNAMNIYQLHRLSNSYQKIGYSNTDIKIHLNKIYTMPIFYILMTIIGFLIINKIKKVKSKFFTIIFRVLISVIVYYLNYFSKLLGSKGFAYLFICLVTNLNIIFSMQYRINKSKWKLVNY